MVHAAGFNAGFQALAAIAGADLLFYAALMPETLEPEGSPPST